MVEFLENVLPTPKVEEVEERVGKILELLDAIYDEMLAALQSGQPQDLLVVYDYYSPFLRQISAKIEEIEKLRSGIIEMLEAKQKREAKTVRMSRGGEGCVVVKLVPCGKNCSGCPHGPYAYLVTKSGGKQHWKYLGKR